MSNMLIKGASVMDQTVPCSAWTSGGVMAPGTILSFNRDHVADVNARQLHPDSTRRRHVPLTRSIRSGKAWSMTSGQLITIRERWMIAINSSGQRMMSSWTCAGALISLIGPTLNCSSIWKKSRRMFTVSMSYGALSKCTRFEKQTVTHSTITITITSATVMKSARRFDWVYYASITTREPISKAAPQTTCYVKAQCLTFWFFTGCILKCLNYTVQ